MGVIGWGLFRSRATRPPAYPHIGKNDRQGGGANSDWQSWARDIQKTVPQIRAAAKVKAQDKFTAAADQLSEACQNCSVKDRAEAPSDGLAGYPFYPKRGLAK